MAWRNYAKTVLPKNATVDQINQLQTAFFGGAISMWHTYSQAALLDDTEKQDIILNALDKEFRELMEVKS